MLKKRLYIVVVYIIIYDYMDEIKTIWGTEK